MSFGLSAFALSSLLTLSAQGATATWTGATSGSWETTSNWNATTPGSGDTALWDTASTANLSVTLGIPQSVFGLKLVNPSGAVSLSGSSLTVGTGGIDMSTATQNLTISSGLTLGSGNQVWNVASGQTLTLNTGTFVRTAGATVNFQGAGTVSSTMTGLSSASLTNGILGPWAFFGTGTATRYATVNGSDNVVSYTGVTTTWAGTVNSATTNYEIGAAGTATYGGSERVANTIRYTGGAGTVISLGNTSSAGLTVNGLINAGTAVITFQPGGGATAAAGIHIGATKELVLNAANAAINVSSPIHNNTGGASVVTVVGPNTVTLSGASDYTGATFVNGSLSISTLANGGSNSSIGASTNVADNLVLNGGTLKYTGTAVSTNRLFSLQTSSTIDASGSGAVNFTNTGSMGFGSSTASKTLTLAGTNTGANTLAAVIGDNTGATSVTKSGTGTWVLSGANTYTGTTTISSGTLAVGASGSINGSATIDVQSGATLDVSLVTGFTVGTSQTLKGKGTIVGATTLSGTVAPGASAGTLSTGALTLQSTAAINFELQSGDVTIGNNVNDLIAVTGNLMLDGTLNVTEAGGSLADGSTYRLFNYSGTLTDNALDISSAFLALHPGSSIDTATTGQVNLLVIPEPATGLMLLSGVGMFTIFRRNRRRHA